MEKFLLDQNCVTLLFLENQNGVHSSYLSEFISFIKSQKVTMPFTFSYVGDQTNLMSTLTLNENILLNFTPKSLTTEKENQFEDYLNQKQNIYIKKLYEKLTERDIPTHAAIPEMKKLASLIKALTTESEYLFLENPEKDLSENLRILFTMALETHREHKKINTFYFSQYNEDLWKTHCTHTVSRNKYFQFQLESIIVDKTINKTAA
jgi:ABC-type multidrug transport system ATPase subunit